MPSWIRENRRTAARIGWAFVVLAVVRYALTRGPSAETIAEGRELFEHVWTVDDPLSAGGDGLGPVFNERSCVACHFQGGVGGGGTNEFNVTSFEALPVLNRPERIAGVVHADATEPAYLESEDTVRRRFPVQKDRVIDQGGCFVRVLDFDPLRFESVNTPPLFGLALVDDVSDWTIRRNSVSRSFGQMGREFSGDFDSTPAGRPRKVSGGFGKFGWKGQFSSLEDFVATACAVELGLSNPVRRQDVPHESREDEDAELDMDRGQLRALVAFVRSLPRPEQVLPTDPTELVRVERGEAVFTEVGCADCHTPSLGGIDGLYSDLLMHEVEQPRRIEGSGYGDEPEQDPALDRDDAGPSPNEWKTPPLWGVADSAPYFHDGESPTLESAIRRHGGHARFSLERHDAAPERDRENLILFLKTLRAPVTAIPVSLSE